MSNLGAPDLNLKAVAKHFIDVDMSKGLRTHNWEIRPISSNRKFLWKWLSLCLYGLFPLLKFKTTLPWMRSVCSRATMQSFTR